MLSDHFPILLEGGSHQRGQIPFRFENVAEGGGVFGQCEVLVGELPFLGDSQLHTGQEVDSFEIGPKKVE